MNLRDIDVIVVGGGPAGSSAATMVARNRWKVLVIDHAIEEGFLGGQGNVSYFPGITDSTTGVDLVRRFRKQAELVGAQFKSAKVHKVTANGETPRVSVGGSDMLECKALILASGAAMRTNYLHGEKEFLGRGVSHNASADGPVFLHRKVAVIGKNQESAEEALRLARFAGQVVFIIPSSKLDAEESVQKKIRDNKKIELFLSTSLKKINGSDHVNSVTVFTGGQEKDLEVSGVFPYVHDYQPMNEYLKGVLEMADSGAVKVNDEFQTSADGVFACGDILCARPQIPTIACAQGLLAGLKVSERLGEGL